MATVSVVVFTQETRLLRRNSSRWSRGLALPASACPRLSLRRPQAPELPLAKLPKTVREATKVHGPEWWDTISWNDFRRLHGLTLVGVPKNCRAAYADLVVPVIAEVEDAGPAMLAGDPPPEAEGLDEAQCHGRHGP